MTKLLNSKKWTLISDLESPPALCIGIQLTTISCSGCLGSWFSYLFIFTLVHTSSWTSAWVTSSRWLPRLTRSTPWTLVLQTLISQFFQCAIKGFPSAYWHCIPVYHTLQITWKRFCSECLCEECVHTSLISVGTCVLGSKHLCIWRPEAGIMYLPGHSPL